MLEIFGGLEIFAQIGFHLSQGGTDPRGESGGGRFAGHGGWKHKQVECLAVPWRGNLLFCFHGCGGCCRLPLWYFLRYLAATWSAVILNTSLALTAMMSLGKRFCNFAFWIPGTEREAMPVRRQLQGNRMPTSSLWAACLHESFFVNGEWMLW